MQRSVCNCSFNGLQKISSSLGQDTLSFDTILQIGSDFIGYFQTIIDCERCVTTKRMTNILSQITSRLVCFYEAAYLNAATTNAIHPRARSTSDAGLLLSPPLSQHGQPSPLSPAAQPAPNCQSMFGEMKLGRLTLEGHEARILAEVILVDTCLELNEKIQEWRLVMDEMAEATGEQCDAASSNCLDRLAKLIGLLQFDGLPVQSC
ncbi:hypothetical protein BBK36DRAFT_1144998 [Trichoderma citrinoviride]|uniref:Uncharacterized protein n=1 Tax=Trichoderma citrinoviride TaxID=58853 RepID=A0A2T4AYQ9_9HYPO|nr:hypothetical protein BBK36DRAFT_1144998 [Trichoderma citrinoviride]PTB62204.1 hypothetical protein BBK36DRAFT_1144998 [Trichoderma citrinoviride]